MLSTVHIFVPNVLSLKVILVGPRTLPPPAQNFTCRVSVALKYGRLDKRRYKSTGDFQGLAPKRKK